MCKEITNHITVECPLLLHGQSTQSKVHDSLPSLSPSLPLPPSLSPSPSLPPQELIELICNVQSMEDAVVEMKYDVKRAPLGKTLAILSPRLTYFNLIITAACCIWYPYCHAICMQGM